MINFREAKSANNMEYADSENISTDFNKIQMQEFGKMNLLIMAILYLLTFGIYLLYWMYLKVKKVNKFITYNPISMTWIFVLSTFTIFTYIVWIINELLIVDNKFLIATHGFLCVICLFIGLAIVFKMRSRIHYLAGVKRGDLYWISAFVVVFLHCFYLQYKINGGSLESGWKGMGIE